MVRVSENSSVISTNARINRMKAELEDLQIKGATLRDINKPSDNPINNLEALTIESKLSKDEHFIKNINLAVLLLTTSEAALQDISETLGRAKELMLSLTSDSYGKETRNIVANELKHLRDEAVISLNKRINNRYIFAGFQGDKIPFDEQGNYWGDDGLIKVEVESNYFIPTNVTGRQLVEKDNLIVVLDDLYQATLNNDITKMRDGLERLDRATDLVLKWRVDVGLRAKSLQNIANRLDSDKINSLNRKGELVDSDIVKLFTDISQKQEILKNAYQTSKNILSQNLLNFIK